MVPGCGGGCHPDLGDRSGRAPYGARVAPWPSRRTNRHFDVRVPAAESHRVGPVQAAGRVSADAPFRESAGAQRAGDLRSRSAPAAASYVM